MNVYEIIMTVLAIIFGGLSLYISGKKNILDAVISYINQAEDEYKDATKAGGSKFEWVVDKLMSIVPVALKPFIGRALVEAIVQKVFDIMQSYAQKQLDKVADKVVTEVKPVAEKTIEDKTIVVNTQNNSDSK